MKHIRARLEDAFVVLRRGDAAIGLQMLEAMRDDAMHDADAGVRATYLQALAGALDHVGRTAEALEAVDAALAIDKKFWPTARGAFLSLHSAVLILRRLGRHDEAAARAAELLALGESRGGLEFAEAAALAAEGMPASDRRVLLERARFACQVAWNESRPRGAEGHDLAASWTHVATQLSDLYLESADLERAENVFGPLMPVLATMQRAPTVRRKFAVAWSRLATIALRRKDTAEARHYLRCALRHAVEERDRTALERHLGRCGGPEREGDPPLDAFVVARRTEQVIAVAHATRGWFALAAEVADALAPFDVVDIAFDEAGRVLRVRRR